MKKGPLLELKCLPTSLWSYKMYMYVHIMIDNLHVHLHQAVMSLKLTSTPTLPGDH